MKGTNELVIAVRDIIYCLISSKFYSNQIKIRITQDILFKYLNIRPTTGIKL